MHKIPITNTNTFCYIFECLEMFMLKWQFTMRSEWIMDLSFDIHHSCIFYSGGKPQKRFYSFARCACLWILIVDGWLLIGIICLHIRKIWNLTQSAKKSLLFHFSFHKCYSFIYFVHLIFAWLLFRNHSTRLESVDPVSCVGFWVLA